MRVQQELDETKIVLVGTFSAIVFMFGAKVFL